MELTETELKLIEITQKFTEYYSVQPKEKRTSAFVTKSIKERIAQYGEEKGYSVCTSGFPGQYECEWLYDLVWYQNDAEGFMIQVPMVLECEQGYHLKHIKYDFEKLLLSNSPLRVMICLGGKKGAQRIIDLCRSVVHRYKHLTQNSRFLLLIWDDYGTGNIIFELICSPASADVSDPSAKPTERIEP